MWPFGPNDPDKEAEKKYQRALQRAREEWEWTKYKPRETKITREEALDKIGGDYEINQLLLIKLEALGLIKFDELVFYKRASWKCSTGKFNFELGELENGEIVLKSFNKIVYRYKPD